MEEANYIIRWAHGVILHWINSHSQTAYVSIQRQKKWHCSQVCQNVNFLFLWLFIQNEAMYTFTKFLSRAQRLDWRVYHQTFAWAPSHWTVCVIPVNRIHIRKPHESLFVYFSSSIYHVHPIPINMLYCSQDITKHLILIYIKIPCTFYKWMSHLIGCNIPIIYYASLTLSPTTYFYNYHLSDAY